MRHHLSLTPSSYENHPSQLIKMPGRTETPEASVADAPMDTVMDDNQSQLEDQEVEYYEDTEETEGYDSMQQRVRIVCADVSTLTEKSN